MRKVNIWKTSILTLFIASTSILAVDPPPDAVHFSEKSSTDLTEGSYEDGIFDVIVVGGGISGASVAFRLHQLGVQVAVAEKADRPGGMISTCSKQHLRWEEGANSFRPMPKLLELIEALKLQDDLLVSAPGLSKYILSDSKLYKAPAGFFGILASDLLSNYAKLQFLVGSLKRLFLSPTQDISCKDYCVRLYGMEIYRKLFEPFINGVCAGDPSKVSASALYNPESVLDKSSPKWCGMMKDSYRKLEKALTSFRRSEIPANFRKLTNTSQCSFKRGLSQICERVYESLGEDIFLLKHQIASLIYDTHTKTWNVEFITPKGLTRMRTKAVVLATPAYVTERILRPLMGMQQTSALFDVEYTPMVVVVIAIPRNQLVNPPLKGVGYLTCSSHEEAGGEQADDVVEEDGREAGGNHQKTPSCSPSILGSIWYTSLFKNQPPSHPDSEVLAFFIGGIRNPGALHMSDESLLAEIEHQLKEISLMKTEAPAPVLLSVKRYSHSIPQYIVGHEKRTRTLLKAIDSYDGLYIVGNYISGSALGHSVQLAYKVADEVVDYLQAGKMDEVEDNANGDSQQPTE